MKQKWPTSSIHLERKQKHDKEKKVWLLDIISALLDYLVNFGNLLNLCNKNRRQQNSHTSHDHDGTWDGNLVLSASISAQFLHFPFPPTTNHLPIPPSNNLLEPYFCEEKKKKKAFIRKGR